MVGVIQRESKKIYLFFLRALEAFEDEISKKLNKPMDAFALQSKTCKSDKLNKNKFEKKTITQ